MSSYFLSPVKYNTNESHSTHLQQTSHISLILLHHTQSVRGTNSRLYFTAGDRATTLATSSITSLRSIAVALSSSAVPADVEANVSRLSEQLADVRKKSNKMLAEIAKFEGARIQTALRERKSVFSYRATDGLDFINLVVFDIKDQLKEEGGVVVLCSGEVKATGSIVIIGSPEAVEGMAAKVKEAVGSVKGGGRGEKWQGKVAEWQKDEIEKLKAAVDG
jgi:misacylated tRNA(Ala) deacylase